MAHRGPMRELFGTFLMLLMVDKSDKTSLFRGHTGYICNTEDAIIDEITHPWVTKVSPLPAPPIGWLAFILALLGDAFYILCNEAVAVLTSFILSNPRIVLAITTCASRRLRELRLGRRVAQVKMLLRFVLFVCVPILIAMIMTISRRILEVGTWTFVHGTQLGRRIAKVGATPTLKTQFDAMRDELNATKKQRQEALDELEAERSRALVQQQSESPIAATTDDHQLANEQRIRTLEQETVAKDGEILASKSRAERAETRAHSAEIVTQDLQRGLDAARSSDQCSSNRIKQLKQSLKTAEEAVEKARNEAQDTVHADTETASQEDISTQTDEAEERRVYQQGYQAAVAHAERAFAGFLERTAPQVQEHINAAVTEQSNAAVAARETEWRAHFAAEVESAVTAREAPLAEALTKAQNEREAMRIDAEAEREEAKKQRKSAEEEKERADREYNRAEAEKERADGEYSRAEAQKELVRRFRGGKAAQDRRIKGYTDQITKLGVLSKNADKDHATEITRLRALSSNPIMKAAELRATENDRLRAVAVINESIHRHYDVQTKQVLDQLLEANTKINNLKGLLKRSSTRSSQIDFLKVLLDAEVSVDMYMSLYKPNRQVLVKQCKAVNARLNELKLIINKEEEPNMNVLLEALYKPRGDEHAEYDDDDPDPEPSSDEDDDEGNAGAQNPARRQPKVPVSRGPRPATQAQSQDAPLPNGPRPDNERKRKGEFEANGSNKQRKDASEMEMRPMAGPSNPSPQQGSSSSDAADGTMETEPASQSPAPTDITFNVPKTIASALVTPTPAKPNQAPIFQGLSLLGAAMANKESMTNKMAALPGLPPPDEDDVLEFESSAVTEERSSNREAVDRFLTHDASDNEEDEEEVAWDDTRYSSDRDEDPTIIPNTYTHASTRHLTPRHPNPQQTPNWLDDDQSTPVRALDMTEQNYEEQAAEFAGTAQQGTQQAPSKKKDSKPQNGEEELEDNFHVDLD